MENTQQKIYLIYSVHNMFGKYNRSNQQLVAHCFFANGSVQYENYDKYYQEQAIIDKIESEADY